MKEFFKPTFAKVVLLLAFSASLFLVSAFNTTASLGFPFPVIISPPSSNCGFDQPVEYGNPTFIVCDGRENSFSPTGFIGDLLVAYLLACLVSGGVRKIVRVLPGSKRSVLLRFSSAFTLRPDLRKFLWTVGLLAVTGIPHYLNPLRLVGGEINSFGFPFPYLNKYFCNGCVGDQWEIEWPPLVVDLIAIYLLVTLVVGSVRYLRLTRATHNHYDDATPPPAN